MPYNPNNLSKTTIQKIFFVLEEINLCSEIRNRKHFLYIRTGKLRGVTQDEQVVIIDELIRDKTIKENRLAFLLLVSSSTEDNFLLNIDNAFFDFYYRVKLQLAEKDKSDVELTSIHQENKIIDNEIRKTLKLKEDTHWEDIELIFKSTYIVELRANNYKYETDYEKMGFADKRKNINEKAKFKDSWGFLILLSVNNNIFEIGKLAIKERDKYKKKKQQLSKLLSEYFQIEDDPIIYDKETGIYKMRMKLKPEETFRKQWEDQNIYDQPN